MDEKLRSLNIFVRGDSKDALSIRNFILLVWGIILAGFQISLPKRVARRIYEEAKRLGMSSDEYLVELITQSLDPKNRAREYIETAKELLEEAYNELRKKDIRQAAEKLWGAVALAVKAYAYWRENKRLASHGELWKYVDKLINELGEWISDAWNAGQSMHVCFYEGWCTEKHVELALKRIERLVEEIASRIYAKA